jgi:hypothetical protein
MTTNFYMNDQNGILLCLVFSNLGDVVNGSVWFSAILVMLSMKGKGLCLLEFHSLSSAVETVPGEYHVLV